MRFDVLSLFPEMFGGALDHSILKIAQQKGALEVHHWNIRDFSDDRHRSVDDRPFGGGPGMVMMPEPIFRAVEHARADDDVPGMLVMLTPQGQRLDQPLVRHLADQKRIVLLCGRYEGIDERVRTGLNPLEVSIGDYVLSGGEIPAMVLVDAVTRLLPGVLGEPESLIEESFSREGWLEYPQYTRPREFRGMAVPEVLLSGHHAEIAAWRREQARERFVQQDNRLHSDAPDGPSLEGNQT